MVWYPRHKPKLKENFAGVVYTFIQSAMFFCLKKDMSNNAVVQQN